MLEAIGRIMIVIFGFGVAAALAAAAAFYGTIIICVTLMNGESSQIALVLAPIAAVVSALVVFVLVLIFCFGKSRSTAGSVSVKR